LKFSIISANNLSRLVNEYFQPITEPNREGEACVRGPNLFKGYLGDPSFNEEAFTHDGWFKTGDLMLCKGGKWYITGRRKVSAHLPSLLNSQSNPSKGCLQSPRPPSLSK
jgi:long-subunit acyl-CoA synthetase (AMP-forming)